MNFLAHFYLAGDDSELVVGNFLGDAVNGSKLDVYPNRIKEGILMHRAIDSFSDKHPILLKSKEKLKTRYRHYSGVIVDIFYDHFLAINWNKYSDVSLKDFSLHKYKQLAEANIHFNKKSRKMFNQMVKHNWLVIYLEIDGISRVLNGMSRRTVFKSNMEFATQELLQYYEEFNEEFQAFFPDIIDYTNKYRKQD